MNKTKQEIPSILMCVLVASVGIARGQTPTTRNAANSSEIQLTSLLTLACPAKRTAFSLTASRPAMNASSPSFNITPMAAGPNLTVLGGGTLGRLTKWTGFTSSNSFIGDSTIFEDKFGMVGIGTDTPTSKLTVAGMIQSMGGGLKFPDGTVQTTSASGALLTVQHDSTLTGGGTQASPLGVAWPRKVPDLDNPARQPVQVHTGCSTQAALCEIVIYNVPANKRLVIEYASMAGAIGTGQVALFDLETTLSGNDVVHAV